MRDIKRAMRVFHAPRQGNILRNIFEVLQEKQNAIARLNREIAALRLAAALLTDDSDTESLYANPPVGTGAHGDRSKDLSYLTQTSVSNQPAHADMAEEGDIDAGTARRIALRIRQLAGPFWNVRRSLVDSAS
jgi:hypothetical protein